MCPEDYVMVSVGVLREVPALWRRDDVAVSCCRLPQAGMLRGEPIDVAVDTACPEGAVAVGISPGSSCRECKQHLTCRSLDGQRYSLGGITSGVFWGDRRVMGESSRRIDRHDVPAGLRYGVGRTGLTSWAESGCLGYPWGSVLTKLPAPRSCDKSEFRELIDRHSGRPLSLVPDCADVSDELDPESTCIAGR